MGIHLLPGQAQRSKEDGFGSEINFHSVRARNRSEAGSRIRVAARSCFIHLSLGAALAGWSFNIFLQSNPVR